MPAPRSRTTTPPALIWSHESVEYSHYKNSQGKIFTLSPWPMEDYWAWTKQVDPADYEVK